MGASTGKVRRGGVAAPAAEPGPSWARDRAVFRLAAALFL